MAIKIKRTPVLKEAAAATFMRKVRSKKSAASSKKVKAALASAKKILAVYKKST